MPGRGAAHLDARPHKRDVAVRPAARNKGWRRAVQDKLGAAQGVNVVDGRVTYRAVADAFGPRVHRPAEMVAAEPAMA
jgi:alanine dehydrogenase